MSSYVSYRSAVNGLLQKCVFVFMINMWFSVLSKINFIMKNKKGHAIPAHIEPGYDTFTHIHT